MQAVIVNDFNEAPVLADLDTPEPGGDRLLLKVVAAGLNPIDVAITQGAFEAMIPATFPLILGSDLVAEVVDAGGPGSRFAAGDLVFGQLLVSPLGSAGAFAEYVQLAQDPPLATLPAGLDPVTAAAVPTPGGTALEVADLLGDVAGRTVLVVGAGGGVGSFLTQILAKQGAEVVAGASARDAARLTGYGAAATLDYARAPVAEAVRASHPDGIDVLVDLADDAAVFAAIASHVRSGGAAVSTRYAADPVALSHAGVRATNFLFQATAQVFTGLGSALVAGELVAPPVREVGLEEVPALLAPDAARLPGKTVIRFR